MAEELLDSVNKKAWDTEKGADFNSTAKSMNRRKLTASFKEIKTLATKEGKKVTQLARGRLSRIIEEAPEILKSKAAGDFGRKAGKLKKLKALAKKAGPVGTAITIITVGSAVSNVANAQGMNAQADAYGSVAVELADTLTMGLDPKYLNPSVSLNKLNNWVLSQVTGGDDYAIQYYEPPDLTDQLREIASGKLGDQLARLINPKSNNRAVSQ